MELALVLRELWSRKLILALGVVVAVIAAVLSVYRLDGLKLKPRSLSFSSASTQVLIDTRQSALGDTSQNVDPLLTRATMYANLMTSPSFLDQIGAQVGIAGNQIYAAGPVDPQMARTVQEPTAVKRNIQLTGESNPYRFNFDNDPNLPQISVFAQAPNTKMAISMANAAAATLEKYVSQVEDANSVPQHTRIAIRQLGSAAGGVVNGGVSKTIFGLVFVAVLAAWCVGMLAVTRFRQNWRATAGVRPDVAEDAGGIEPAGRDLDHAAEAPAMNGRESERGGAAERVKDGANGARPFSPRSALTYARHR